MAKYKCPFCGRPSEKKEGCFYHKPKKPLRASAKTVEQMEENSRETQKMWDLFTHLWNRLPARKYCWACKAPIWGENLSIYWDHLLEKSSFPELKFEEQNLFFCCPDCHTRKGNGFPHIVHKQAIEKAKEIFGVL